MDARGIVYELLQQKTLSVDGLKYYLPSWNRRTLKSLVRELLLEDRICITWRTRNGTRFFKAKGEKP